MTGQISWIEQLVTEICSKGLHVTLRNLPSAEQEHFRLKEFDDYSSIKEFIERNEGSKRSGVIIGEKECLSLMIAVARYYENIDGTTYAAEKVFWQHISAERGFNFGLFWFGSDSVYVEHPVPASLFTIGDAQVEQLYSEVVGPEDLVTPTQAVFIVMYGERRKEELRLSSKTLAAPQGTRLDDPHEAIRQLARLFEEGYNLLHGN